MTDLEQAADAFRRALAEWDAAEAEISAHEANIERLNELTAGYIKRRSTAAAALRSAREKLCNAAAPVPPIPETAI